ncbi:unnamed protein product [Dracunculus medinensis]|uniref:Sulfate_transp domain-containing protein n=1 Tax=Dracunculus medinensis TaxID=318479 RepID=A0A0N4UPI0_DRAME|nr:unnamed protein product [Dracunculus medinensis]
MQLSDFPQNVRVLLCFEEVSEHASKSLLKGMNLNSTVTDEISPPITQMRKNFMRQSEFDELYDFCPPPKIDKKVKNYAKRILYPFFGKRQFLTFLVSLVPCIKWLSNYKWKSYIIGDFVAGITIGVMHLSAIKNYKKNLKCNSCLGIAYAILSGVDPVYGLYSSFFPVLFYMILGTSKHASIGKFIFFTRSFAIVNLMTGTSQSRILTKINQNHLENEVSYIGNAVKMGASTAVLQNLTANIPLGLKDVTSIQIVSSLTFCVGIVHILMAVFRIEFLASYLSDQLISGFSTGASIHVIIVQLDKIFQINVARKNDRVSINLVVKTMSMAFFAF